MPATYTPITKGEMDSFFTELGFKRVILAGISEDVYGKIIAKNICCRVFTSIVGSHSREVGGDAIRVCVVKRYPDGAIRGIGKSRRVHRTQNWRINLQHRIEEMVAYYTPHVVTAA